MTKKIKRLHENKILRNAIQVGTFAIGVILIAPIFANSLSLAQKLQRMGTPSSWQNMIVALNLVIISVMVYFTYKHIVFICEEITKQRNEQIMRHKMLLNDEIDARVLRKNLFKEIKDKLPIPDEEDLWMVICQLNKNQLLEAREDRDRILYEMGIEILYDEES